MLKGIDISRWQGIINWDAVKSAGIRFAFIKACGSDDGFYVDGQFARNRDEARRLELPRGYYAYLGGNHATADEIKHIVNSIGSLQPGEVIAIDWEETNSVEVAYLTEIVDGLKAAGYPAPLIYMSLSRVRGQNWQALVDRGCGLWVAAWGDNDDVPEDSENPPSDEWPFWAVWQFSSTGSVPGISGRVDMDMFNGDDIDAFSRYGTSGPVQAPAPQPVTPTVVNDPHTNEYVVVGGDTLSGIAARYGTTWQNLFALNSDRLSNPNRIFVGQHLRVPGSVTPAPQNQNITVAVGDTLSSIAIRFGTNWQQIYAWNRDVIGPNPNFIKPGQVLRVK